MGKNILSLSMIIRDCDESLNKCLESCHTLFDEIILVDTKPGGSEDSTIKLADKYHAKLIQYEWCDDFSKARNLALKACSSKYVMWLDSDDYITEENLKKLFILKKNLYKDIYMSYVMTYNYSRDLQGNVKKPTKRRRLVLNDKGVEWKYPIHEVLSFSSPIPKGKEIAVNIEIEHDNKRDTKTNLSRNVKILKKAVLTEEYKDNGRIWFYLAREYMDLSMIKESFDIFEEHYENMPDYLLQNSTLYYAYCAYYLKKYDLSKELCEKGISKDSRYAEFYCLIGKIYYDKENYQESKEWYEKASKLDMPRDTIELVHAEYYDRIPKTMLRSIGFHLSDISKEDISFLLPVHESPSSKKLMPIFLNSWKNSKADKYSNLYIMNNGCESWLKDEVDKSGITNFKIIDLGENRGFIGAINDGIDATNSKYVGFLNTDVVFRDKEWVPNLAYELSKESELGAVGFNGRTYSINGKDITPWIEFCCVLFKREALNSVGKYLDRESFGHGYFDDDDLCLRLIMGGWELRTIYPMIIHNPRQSTPDYVEWISNNYIKFLEKYEDVNDRFIQEYILKQRLFFQSKCPWVLTRYTRELSNRIKTSKRPLILTCASGNSKYLSNFMRAIGNNLNYYSTPFVIMKEPYFRTPLNYLYLKQGSDFKENKHLNSVIMSILKEFNEDRWYIVAPANNTIFQKEFTNFPEDKEIIVSNTGSVFKDKNTPHKYKDLIGKNILNSKCFIIKGKFYKQLLSDMDSSCPFKFYFNNLLIHNQEKVSTSSSILTVSNKNILDTVSIENNTFIKDNKDLYDIVYIEENLRPLIEGSNS